MGEQGTRGRTIGAVHVVHRSQGAGPAVALAVGMRAVTVIVFAALVLAAVGVLLLLPEARWISIIFAAGAVFVGILLVSRRGRVEEEKRTHQSGQENRLR